MFLDDFDIGTAFWTYAGPWRCTDVGARSVRAIFLDSKKKSVWFEGPPYCVDEITFDENDLLGCYPTEDAPARDGEALVSPRERSRQKTTNAVDHPVECVENSLPPIDLTDLASKWTALATACQFPADFTGSVDSTVLAGTRRLQHAIREDICARHDGQLMPLLHLLYLAEQAADRGLFPDRFDRMRNAEAKTFVEAGPPTLKDFKIGIEFLNVVGKWRCTDIGSRTITAIHLDDRVDASWFDGPPYSVVEEVFDEDAIAKCYFHELQALAEAGSESHPGFDLEDVSEMMKAHHMMCEQGYPNKGLLRFDRISHDGRIFHPYAAIHDGELWQILCFSVFDRMYFRVPEDEFIELSRAGEVAFSRAASAGR